MQSAQTITQPQVPPLAVARNNDCFQNEVPDYALLFFDHLYSEYSTLRSKIDDKDSIALLDSLQEKRLVGKITWSDIYTFDSALIEERPLENLIRKAFDARAKYRSIAGQKEFDEYLASKPPDLTAILVAPSNNPDPQGGPPPDQPVPMPQSSEIIKRVLRADIRYLLSKFYLYYAMLPMREGLRERLTSRAVRMTKWILAIILILIMLSFSGSLLLKHFLSSELWSQAAGELLGAFGPMVGSVALAGIVGGCISMLQRIQSAPSEGDALFNLAALNNGWRGLSLSPLYGGVFASLLFILFAAGLLQGSAFPRIETNGSTPVANTEQVKTTEPDGQSAPEANSNPALLRNASVNTQQVSVLKIKDFLRETGPKDGVSFALLMIWSFVAGFAERLVPDTLNRLVAKTEALQGTNT